ncbi:MAG: Stp1/IreP family PP2C-type Ser/Thr phosphatase [Desulfitobacterium hafniense]|nr:Stp1/IreP family PP2C-type Ser/Thr phosphatase [Desulfitobacterium hafniense]
MRVLSFSETGSVRKNNEDSYLVLAKEGIYAVADGMGGHSAGEIASRTALEPFASLASDINNVPAEMLEEWVKEVLLKANSLVYESSRQNPGCEGMGTTLTALVIREGLAVVGHVGDSRAYLWRDENLTSLTIDHSLVGELVRAGQITIEEAEKHPQRHVLVRAIGANQYLEVDCLRLPVRTGDVFILCTDGFSNLISEAELAEELRKTGSWEEHFERLKSLVVERGATDNFTALCCILE